MISLIFWQAWSAFLVIISSIFQLDPHIYINLKPLPDPLLLFYLPFLSGITLTLSKSLLWVLEQEKIELFRLEDIEVVPTSPIKAQLIRKDSQSASMKVSERNNIVHHECIAFQTTTMHIVIDICYETYWVVLEGIKFTGSSCLFLLFPD